MASVRKLISQRGPHIAILGPPGSGKSTLVRSLALFLGRKGVYGKSCLCLELDLRTITVGSDLSMYKQLSAMIRAWAHAHNLDIGLLEDFGDSLSQLARLTTGYLVIVVDHLDDVPFDFAIQLTQHLRGLKEMSEGGILTADIGIIVSGCISVFRLRKHHQSGLAQTAAFLLPRPLTSERKKLVQAAAKQRYFKFTADALECLVAETGGEPTYLLPVLDRLVDCFNDSVTI